MTDPNEFDNLVHNLVSLKEKTFQFLEIVFSNKQGILAKDAATQLGQSTPSVFNHWRKLESTMLIKRSQKKPIYIGMISPYIYSPSEKLTSELLEKAKILRSRYGCTPKVEQSNENSAKQDIDAVDQKIIDFFKQESRATVNQVHSYLKNSKINLSTPRVRARVRELAILGMIHDSGEKIDHGRSIIYTDKPVSNDSVDIFNHGSDEPLPEKDNEDANHVALQGVRSEKNKIQQKITSLTQDLNKWGRIEDEILELLRGN
jgi:DNA-binding Lrp family transcriptional regulator/predicted transcriptional regulator